MLFLYTKFENHCLGPTEKVQAVRRELEGRNVFLIVDRKIGKKQVILIKMVRQKIELWTEIYER